MPVSPLERSTAAPLERVPLPPAPKTRHWLLAAVARGLALFIGGFTLLSVIGAARSEALDANIWWVAVPFVPRLVSAALLAAVGVAFVAYAVAPRLRAWRRWPTLALFAFFVVVVAYNTVDFYLVSRAGDIAPGVPLPLSLVIALLLVFAYAISWVMAWIGMLVPSPEVVNNASFIIIFPVTFLANTFVQIDTMPRPLQIFAEWNPVSAVTQAARELFGNIPPGTPAPTVWTLEHPIAYTLLWAVAVLIVFVPLANWQYRRSTSR